MTTFDIEVTQTVRVTLDETKFDEAFMEGFRDDFYPFDTLAEHAEHIGQLYARGLINLGWERADFIEGYGHAHEMGISVEEVSQEQRVLPLSIPSADR